MASNGGKNDKTPEERRRSSPRHSESRQRNRPHFNSTTNTFKLQSVDNLQVGNHNIMNVFTGQPRRQGPYTRSQCRQSDTEVLEAELTTEQQSRLAQLQVCPEEVDSNLMAELSKNWGKSWHRYGKMLTLDESRLKNIEDSVKEVKDKRRELSYQVLLSWTKKTDDPSVKNLIRLLTSTNDFSPIMALLTSDDWKN